MLCGCWISRFSLNAGMNFHQPRRVMCPVVELWGNAVWRCGASSSPAKPWLGLGTIDWCAGVRSTPVYASELDALAAAAVRLASTWDAALRSA